MRLKFNSVAGVLAVTLLVTATTANAENRRMKIHKKNPNGTPGFVTGDLGRVISPKDSGAALRTMARRSVNDDVDFKQSAKVFLDQFIDDNYNPAGTETMVAKRHEVDGAGTAHVKFIQRINGRRVFGARMLVHVDMATGEVYAVNGEFIRDTGLPSEATVKPRRMLKKALKARGITKFKVKKDPRLGYVVRPEGDKAALAWKIRVRYRNEAEIRLDDIFVDATTGQIVTMHPKIHPIRSVQTFDARLGTSLPGRLVCTDDQTCDTNVAQAAHDNAKATYDYMFEKFNRDSLDDNGFTLRSTVNVRDPDQPNKPYNNAYWNGYQMAYGDGDGVVFRELGYALDVVAHEFGHGVTTNESNLIYNGESGALNEAWSDILSAGVEAWKSGGISEETWKLGEDIYTPGTSGDALRYLNNPTKDGSSRDYYPERYTGSADAGGVHINSGIANLAFYLLVEGGKHPRNKTSVNVTQIGLSKAEQIFYRAQTTYLTPSSNFEAARAATAQAAKDLYGDDEHDAVHEAWDAVGVPGSNTGGGNGGGNTSGGELQRAVAETGISVSTGGKVYYNFTVPAGATNLTVNLSGGTGDADLYLRRGSQPTTSAYDCRPYKDGNTEACSVPTPGSGKWHVMVVGYKAATGVRLIANWDEATGGGNPPAGGVLQNGVVKGNLSGSTGSTAFYTFDLPAGAKNLRVATSGGSGDVDLYLRRGSKPTTSAYDCRPYEQGNAEVCSGATPGAGTWHVMIRGYTAFGGVNLVASWDEATGGNDPGPQACTPGSITKTEQRKGWWGSEDYSITVPACATTLTVTTSGGSGNSDLYVNAGSSASSSNYDCKSTGGTTSESCTLNNAGGKVWNVQLKAKSFSYRGVKLVMSYQ